MSSGRVQALVAGLLLAGVMVSACLLVVALVGAMAVGWLGSLLDQGARSPTATNPGSLLDGLAVLRPYAIAQLGLLVLVATPVLRVAATLLGFALEGDRRYAAMSLVVLVIVLVSLLAVR